MTIFVGPNNAGKSRVLREIESASFDARWPPQNIPFILPRNRLIVDSVEVNLYGRDELMAFLSQIDSAQRWDVLRNEQYNLPFDPQQMSNAISQTASNPQSELLLNNSLRRERICLLDGLGRLNLVMARPVGPLSEKPRNHLQSFYVDNARRAKLAHAVHAAFGSYVLIDATDLATFKFCLSDVLPASGMERSLDDDALRFYSQARKMLDASDGVKAYTGILSAVLSTKFDTVLIDEPEAFLHPPLARRLGFTLAELAREQSTTVFASTHSADFLTGCVQSGCEVDVIRLTYDQNLASARLLSNNRLTKLMRDPLLRSTGVLTALFNKGAVICESDTDRAFYNEINDRVLRFSQGGVTDSVFLNAQNWQTCANLISPLREMGIPAVAIVDLDVLLVADFSKLLTAANVPEASKSGMTQTRSQLKIAFERSISEEGDLTRTVKSKGVACLTGSDLQAANSFLSQLQEYGIFLVPVGEVEKWLPHTSVVGKASAWLIPTFERMGSNPESAGYLKPAFDDVWGFLRAVGTWISNPNRLGMAFD